jgi:hypothetical protein
MAFSVYVVIHSSSNNHIEIGGLFKDKDKAQQFCEEKNKQLEKRLQERYLGAQTTIVESSIRRG